MLHHDMRIARSLRQALNLGRPVFSDEQGPQGLYQEANAFAFHYNQEAESLSLAPLSPADLNASVLLHALYQSVLDRVAGDIFSKTLPDLDPEATRALSFYATEFPSPLLASTEPDRQEEGAENLRGFFVHRVMQVNPALQQAIGSLIAPKNLVFPPETRNLIRIVEQGVKRAGTFQAGGRQLDLFALLTEPARRHPTSLADQIQYILGTWSTYIPQSLSLDLMRAITVMKEEHKPRFEAGGPAPTLVPDYSHMDEEYEAYTPDKNWMPNVVMMAKSTLVWLDQLTKSYGRPITRLDQIPDEELDKLQREGFTALWLIGLWQRSAASKRIKNLCGNPDAEASAYSLYDYEISADIGGWDAVANLRERCKKRGIRLASDMVPNHTGIDSKWVMEHPEYFIQQDYPPFPSYTYNGPDLSTNPNVEIKLEDHYYNRTDAAVTFRRTDKRTGKTSYVFHGNDGTTMPWNDTAQLDFLNPLTREAVYQEILHVARNFPIIRFDAAMTLAKRHIRRLWYPAFGSGGDIAGRAGASMSEAEFNARIPKEFWREVVDRMETDLPDTLLLAEAFWMMEGYFVRTLGMHRVYNSAFMNMLKNQENQKYRDAIKKTLAFDPEILKRYVNFMNNPDEETAVAQFGEGDKYFGVCTLLSTMPGLPMFGHGQLEGFREKYGMEYKRAYWDEKPNQWLLDQHERRIFPLLRHRYLYSGADYFQLFDLIGGYGAVAESAYCYTNGTENERSLVLYNNQFQEVSGTILRSCEKLVRHGDERDLETVTIAEAMNLKGGANRYVVYTRFPDHLTYLRPSQDIVDKGLFFHLNGYEAQVFIGIHEVEDTDGTYRELYKLLDGKGMENLEDEVAWLRLRPVYARLVPLKESSTLETISRLTSGKAPRSSARKLALLLAECQQSLLELKRDDVKASDLKEILSRLESMSRLFDQRKTDKVFLHAAEAMGELDWVIALALALTPFTTPETTVKEAMVKADKLLLHRFASCPDSRKVSHMAAILLTAGHVPADGDAKAVFKTMLEDESVRQFAGCNTYNGVTFYKKETMQELIVLAALSLASWGRPKAEEFLWKMLDAEEGAAYRLDSLLN